MNHAMPVRHNHGRVMREAGGAANSARWRVPDDIRANYLACYVGDRFAESMRYVRRYPEELPASSPLIEDKAG